MRSPVLPLVLVLAVGPVAISESGTKRPAFSLAATPRSAFPPIEIHFIAKIEGGTELEDYKCPEIEWDWNDGGRTVRQSDCSPDEPEIETRYRASHVYAEPGTYLVSVTLRRMKRTIASASTNVDISGLH
jgi:PKD repeat protein